MRARPQPESCNEAGFTLVEILAVLIIIGVMSSVVILSIPTPKAALDKQAELMVGTLNKMAQESIINGRVSAAGFDRSGYVLYQYADDAWQEMASDEWDASYRLKYKREGAALDIPKKAEPSILFQPTGLSTPFELAMSDKDSVFTLVGAGDGRIILRKDP